MQKGWPYGIDDDFLGSLARGLEQRTGAVSREHMEQMALARHQPSIQYIYCNLPLEAAMAQVTLYLDEDIQALIAATALRHQAELVTRNTREFARVPGLRCQDWHKS